MKGVKLVIDTWNGKVRIMSDSDRSMVLIDIDADTARLTALKLLNTTEKIDGLKSVITQPNRFSAEDGTK